MSGEHVRDVPACEECGRKFDSFADATAIASQVLEVCLAGGAPGDINPVRCIACWTRFKMKELGR